MYEMMTGRVPFGGPSNVHILTAHLYESPPPMRSMRESTGPTRQIEEIVGRCIEKDRERRFGSMAEVLAALERLTEPLPAYAAALCRGCVQCAVDGQMTDDDSGRAPSKRPAADDPDGLMRPATTAALAVLAIAALVGAGTRRSDPSTVVARPAFVRTTDAAGPSPSKERHAEAPVPRQDFTIEVTTEPQDSMVKEGNVELCRTTPCAILYGANDGDPGAIHVLTVSRDGYRSETRKVTTADSSVAVTLTPVPILSARPRVAPRAPLGGEPMPISAYRLEVPY
jgi:serine/threonine-protein kinase